MYSFEDYSIFMRIVSIFSLLLLIEITSHVVYIFYSDNMAGLNCYFDIMTCFSLHAPCIYMGR